MRRYTCLVMAWVWTGMACNSASLNKAPFLPSSTFVEDRVASSGDAEEAKTETPAANPLPMPAENKTPEEKVSPPANISGSYLICAETKAATDASPEAIVNCGLRDQKTNNKINIEAGYASKIWSYQASSSNLVVSMVELPLSLEWHIAVTLKAATLAEVVGQRDSIRFFVSVSNSLGVKFQESAPVTSSFVRWLALNGEKIPAGAAIGGTENGGRVPLFLCRIYIGAEVLPGKLLVHFHDSNKSVCYATQNGSTVQSQSDDGRTMFNKSDVLVITQAGFDDYFEWIPSANGLKPAQAMITGVDGLGNPHYTCRNLQINNGTAEQTPGVLRPGSSSCSHEFFGAKSSSNYQVLAWKEAASKKIMESRPLPLP